MRLTLTTAMLAAALATAPAAHAQAPAGNAEAGKKKTAMCAGCHGIPGYKTAYPDVYHVPKLGGQTQVYLLNSLRAYRSGERSHPSMRGIAASLTDQDMADIAAYYGGAAK